MKRKSLFRDKGLRPPSRRMYFIHSALTYIMFMKTLNTHILTYINYSQSARRSEIIISGVFGVGKVFTRFYPFLTLLNFSVSFVEILHMISNT